MSAAFTYEEKVLFRHCDPAGIVFFPRYFEMINDCVEYFFSDTLNWPFEKVLKNGGVPTATITTNFVAPSRHGDVLRMEFSVVDIGRTSMRYSISVKCAAGERLRADATLVHVGNTGRPASWPKEISKKLQSIVESTS